jgi:hypothetical protein
LIVASDLQPGLRGFFYVDLLRQFTSVFYHLSYLLGLAVGAEGSFVPSQLVYGALWLGRSVLTWLIVRALLPDKPALAIFAGLIVSLHAADAALNWVGQLNQFGFIFWTVLAFLFFVYAVKTSRLPLG